MTTAGCTRLRTFVHGIAHAVERHPTEPDIVDAVSVLLAEMVAIDDWLPEELAEPGPTYRQYLVHCDSQERFSIVSFVWGPGQSTPVHDHGTWGVIGVLRGAELSTRFAQREEGGVQPLGDPTVLSVGSIDSVSPSIGDIHQVSNAYADRASLSIHVYGANIGRQPRHAYGESGAASSFVSGYSNDQLPNIWG